MYFPAAAYGVPREQAFVRGVIPCAARVMGLKQNSILTEASIHPGISDLYPNVNIVWYTFGHA